MPYLCLLESLQQTWVTQCFSILQKRWLQGKSGERLTNGRGGSHPGPCASGLALQLRAAAVLLLSESFTGVSAPTRLPTSAPALAPSPWPFLKR